MEANMARLESLDDSLRKPLEALECPVFDEPAFVKGGPLSERRVAIISTAALFKRGDEAFALGASDYRVIPGDTSADDLVMSHVSPNYDRTGFQQDLNVVFPIDRLRELADDGVIGSVADYHYSLMGSTDPKLLAPSVERLAPLLKRDAVNALLLAPV
ncbi:MAG: D-proline reductase (dithiol) PrdB [Gammaproteobacteria bacterium]|jgi:D-proline reductase (dithiol) PrdB